MLRNVLVGPVALGQLNEVPTLQQGGVGICVLGQARTFWTDEVQDSLVANIRKLESLWSRVEVFLAFDWEDQEVLQQRHDVLRVLRPQAVRFDMQEDCETPEVPFCLQWRKYPLCAEMIHEREAELGLAYRWVLRARPDLVWYDGFPDVRFLDPTVVYSNMLCPGERSTDLSALEFDNYLLRV